MDISKELTTKEKHQNKLDNPHICSSVMGGSKIRPIFTTGDEDPVSHSFLVDVPQSNQS
jgi:hypothetical protein